MSHTLLWAAVSLLAALLAAQEWRARRKAQQFGEILSGLSELIGRMNDVNRDLAQAGLDSYAELRRAIDTLAAARPTPSKQGDPQ